MGANLLIAAAIIVVQSSALTTHLQTSDSLSSEPTAGIGYERLSDAFQYNRVQGLSLGVGYRVPVPGLSQTTGYATIRYGFSDERLSGRFSLLHDGQTYDVAISGYHDISEIDPFAQGRSFGNTLNGLFAGHDNGDYALADGGSVTLHFPLGVATGISVGTVVERQRTIGRAAHSAINDFLGGSGLFPLNPAIKEGVFARLLARISRRSRLPFNLSMDVVAGEGETIARLYGDATASVGWRRQLLLRLKAGVGTEPGLPQTLFSVGGVHTVRGFEYGAVRSPSFWAGQLDLSPVGGRFRPVVFLDAGQGGELGELFSTTALVGAGLGLALFHDLLRFELSHPLLPSDAASKLRFDIIFLGLR
jgi:hypothetical protein